MRSARQRLMAWACVPLLGLGLVGCSDDGPSPTARPVPCSGRMATETDDVLGLARRIIDAAQVGDFTTLCSLIGMPAVGEDLVRYHQAITEGLTTDIELVKQRADDQVDTADLVFEIPTRGSSRRLGLGFQHQSIGWVLLLALFTES